MLFSCGPADFEIALNAFGFHQRSQGQNTAMANRKALIPKGDLIRLASACRATGVVIDCEYNGAQFTIRPHALAEDTSDQTGFDARIDEWSRK